MKDKIMSVAIDGPSGSGKSTVAEEIGRRFGLFHLNTGNIYRALAVAVKNAKIDYHDEKKIKSFLKKIELEVAISSGEQIIILDGEKLENETLRKEEIGMISSHIASFKKVREVVTKISQNFAKEIGIVMEGRDTTSVILKKTPFKFYLDASSEERAKRRKKELEDKGQTVDFEKLKNDLKKRDKENAERKIAPLKRVRDAIYIDSTNMKIEEVVEVISAKINEINRL